MIELYHGSNLFIDKIDFTKCKPYKDFGQPVGGINLAHT